MELSSRAHVLGGPGPLGPAGAENAGDGVRTVRHGFKARGPRPGMMDGRTTRTERDSLGPREIPADAYWGVQTLRAMENFPVSGLSLSPHLVRAYALTKEACACANRQLGQLDERRARAIERAAHELAEGRWRSEIRVDVFQAGAGTSTNMNVNEVIANRALEILGRPRGDYAELSPNDHVNRGQSTNDTFPTALNLAILFALSGLEDAVTTLASALEERGRAFAGVPKAGRTHLKDAMPVTLGEEFTAYGSSLRRLLETLPTVRNDLREVALGGSAVGTGINTAPGFRSLAVATLATLSGEPLRSARDPFEAMQSRRACALASSFLRNLALELIRIANDLRLLSSGPATGLDEIRIPEVQPGSSIMPAKVNPSLAECLDQVAFHVVGSDTAVALAVQAGQLEINVMMPGIAFEVLFSAEILTRFLPVFAEKGVVGIRAQEANCERWLVSSQALATVLTPRLGYLKVAELIHEASARGQDPRETAVAMGLLTREEAESLLGREALVRLTRPVD
jgi:aspartate ammonia-lyase